MQQADQRGFVLFHAEVTPVHSGVQRYLLHANISLSIATDTHLRQMVLEQATPPLNDSAHGEYWSPIGRPYAQAYDSHFQMHRLPIVALSIIVS